MKEYILDDICKLITDGSHFSPTDETVGYPMLSVKDMNEDDFDFSECKYVGLDAYEKLISNGCRPQINDVVVAKDGSYLKTAFPIKEDREIALLSSIAILRPDLDKVIPAYLSYFLKSESVYRMVSLNYISGTALKRVILKGLKKIPITLPDIDEQITRSTRLECARHIIRRRKEQLLLLDDLIKARFVEMFGDPVKNEKGLPIKKLGELGIWNSGGTPSRSIPEYFSGTINWYSAGELNSLYLNGSNEKITEAAVKESAAKLFKAGSLLVGMYDTAAFKMGILTEDSASNQACACIEPNNSIDVVWLYYSLSLMRETYLSQRRGVRQKNLNLGMIREFELPVAIVSDQEQFMRFVKQVDKSKVAVQESLDKTQVLFDSLMQEYFG